MRLYRFAKNTFIALVFLSLLTPLVFFRELLFPFISSKGFYFRVLVELALPFYLYLIFSNPAFRPNWKNPLNGPVLVFLAASLLSALIGVDFIRSFWGMFERMDSVFMQAHLVALYFYVLLLAKLSGNFLELFFKALIWVSAIASLNGVIGFLGGPTLAPDISLPARASSTLGNPIFFASFLVLPICLALFFAIRSETRGSKYFYWAMFFLQSLALIFSGTRGAMVGFAGAIFLAAVFYVIFQKNHKARVVGAYVVGSLVVLAILLFIFRQHFPGGQSVERLLTFKDSNTQSRLIQWKTALLGFKDHPFLGVGPNNYYFISNKYYNTEMWKYDRGWFDKPHNYQLEILATGGVIGLTAYLGIVLAVFWSLYRAFKAELLSLMEISVLGAGFLAYQIQNLFVFDTVSASQAFYMFLGFAGYLYSESTMPAKVIKRAVVPPAIAPIILWAAMPFALYSAFAFNWTGGQISRELNAAKSLHQTNFDGAKFLLDRASNASFNFYTRDTAYDYSNFAAWYSNRNQAEPQLAKSKAMMSDAVKASERAVKEHPFDPTVWVKLGNALFARSHLENLGFNQEAYDAGFKAHTLAPKKHDPKLFMASVAIEGKRPDLAEKWLLEILADFPDLEDARWQLADLYYFSERQSQAEMLALEAVNHGYILDRIKKGDWLLTYFYENKQPAKAVEFLLQQAKSHERDGDYFARLADAYNKAGRYIEARAAGLKVLELDPASKAEVEAFLKSLPK